MSSVLKQLMLQFGCVKKIAFICLFVGMYGIAITSCVNRADALYNIIPVNKSVNLSNQVEEIDMLSFKMIKNAGNAVIGYVEETDNFVPSPIAEGGKEKRKIYYVYDTDFKRIGFVTEHGTVSVYKYTRQGAVIQIARDEVFTLDAGNRKLLNYEGAIYYDDFEAAPPWRDRSR